MYGHGISSSSAFNKLGSPKSQPIMRIHQPVVVEATNIGIERTNWDQTAGMWNAAM